MGEACGSELGKVCVFWKEFPLETVGALSAPAPATFPFRRSQGSSPDLCWFLHTVLLWEEREGAWAVWGLGSETGHPQAGHCLGTALVGWALRPRLRKPLELSQLS